MSHNDKRKSTLLSERKYVGLHSSLKAATKLYAKHFELLKPSDTAPGIYEFLGKPILTVDVCGRVVSVHQRLEYTKYKIDDGTGVVCILIGQIDDLPNFETAGRDIALLGGALGKRLQVLLGEQELTREEPYSLGELIHVQGDLHFAFETLEVSVSFHERLSDDHEALRYLELPIIYKNVYMKPAQLPPFVEMQLFTTASGEETKETDPTSRSTLSHLSRSLKCLDLHC